MMKKKASLLKLTNENFNHRVLENVLPVLVLFSASWSGSSDILTPIIEELALEFSGKVISAKIDTDKYSEICLKFGIEAVPTLLFFKNGRVVDRLTGVISKSEVANKLKALLRQ